MTTLVRMVTIIPPVLRSSPTLLNMLLTSVSPYVNSLGSDVRIYL